MAPLNKDRATPYNEGVEVGAPVEADTIIYAGSIVCSSASGYAAPGSDTAGKRFLGIAMHRADNRGGLAGAKTVTVRRSGVFEFAAVSITQAMLGSSMMIVDDQTFDDIDGTTADIRLGPLVKFISETKGWVDIGR